MSFIFLHASFWLLYLILCLPQVGGLASQGNSERTYGTQQSHIGNREKIPLSRKSFLDSIYLVAQSGLLVGYHPSIASAESDFSLEKELRQSLTQPSEDRPRIALPSSLLQPQEANTSASPLPNRRREISSSFPSPSTIQILLTLKNPQVRPAPNDLLVVRVFDRDPTLGDGYDNGLDFNANESGSTDPLEKKPVLLGGAKIPVARIRFPINLQLTSKNAAPSENKIGRPDTARWDSFASSQDLWIAANVCPESSEVNLQRDCFSSNNFSFRATGISKLLRELPIIAPAENGDAEIGADGGGKTQTMSLLEGGIRAPSSLSLEKITP